MLSLAIYIAEILAFLQLPDLTTGAPNKDGDCGDGYNRLPNLNLGLPPNSTVFVSGYLPQKTGWVCPENKEAGATSYEGVHGVFWSYYATGQDVEIGVSNFRQLNNTNRWALYVHQKNNDHVLHFRICKWLAGTYTPQSRPWSRYGQCAVDKRISFTFEHQGNQVLGVTWSSNYVTFYGISKSYRYFLKNDWYRVTVKCLNKYACALYPVYNQTTLNITTNARGLIQSYSVCDSCNGFPAHVFPVLEGGKIPADFDFTNWFYLTNSSTLVAGRVVGIQPLKLLCLWPVPSITANDDKIYFNTTGANCNGFVGEGVADALRFSLNFTANQILNGVHNIILEGTEAKFTFTCRNDSESTLFRVPFGVTGQVYYCFVFTESRNQSYNTFVGILPPILKEIVISRYGSIYLNGVKLFSLPVLQSVIFNVSSKVGSDFWTVAYAQDAQVMVDLNATSITDLLYCDTPLNRLKCQQLSYALEDGFYPTTNIYTRDIPRSYVALPYHATHMVLNITAYIGDKKDDRIQINGFNDSFCVNTTQFTTNFVQTDSGIIKAELKNGDCPFTFDSINNYLTFDSICFSIEPIGGGCTMNIVRTWFGQSVPWRTLYVSYTKGSRITGVKTPNTGVFDPSTFVEDVCTDYTIYGMSGRGVISRSNASYIAGLYYTAISGQLLGFKNATTGETFVVVPCDLSSQAAVIGDKVVGVMTSITNSSFEFVKSIETPNFYYLTNATANCTSPVITYGKLGVCEDGSIAEVKVNTHVQTPVSPISTGNITVPSNFTVSVQVEYLQMYMRPVSVDCAMYVCNGNPHCLRLLTQYASACRTIEDALQLSARLESIEVNSVISVSEDALELANISNFDHYNMSALLPKKNGRSFIEDLLFNKVVTNGLGTVDQDYKKCMKDKGFGEASDIACVQYYNGIMVLPGVVDDSKMALYTAALTGGMLLAAFTAGASIPFSLAVQSRLNYVALQTDVLQKNQQILATSFNNAMSNITVAFTEVNQAIKETSDAINTVAKALGKVQSVVNEQGQALSQLTRQLASNFQAISSSIEDIYNRLDSLAADAQVDRLITGRLGALNAFVTQTLTRYTDARASRQLAIQKINECVKSQSMRYGFCGNGTHLFSIANAAPNGVMLFHTVLIPTEFVTVEAWSGVCVDGTHGLILRDVRTTLFQQGSTYYVTTRDMFEPRTPVAADFVRIANCSVTYVNITADSLGEIIPDYIDVNKTLEELGRPNFTLPDFNLDQFNNTYLNLSAEIALLNAKSESLYNTTQRLEKLIENINNSYIDLELLNRLESYVKWPWYVWLAIFLALILFSFLMLYCCMATGCCGCCSCLSNSCFDCGGRRLQRYEVEKVHIQ
nr:S protein [Bat coronavirus]